MANRFCSLPLATALSPVHVFLGRKAVVRVTTKRARQGKCTLHPIVPPFTLTAFIIRVQDNTVTNTQTDLLLKGMCKMFITFGWSLNPC